MADPECARGGGVSHILAEKKGVSFTLLKQMHENSIFSPIAGGVRQVRPKLDPPLGYLIFITQHPFCTHKIADDPKNHLHLPALLAYSTTNVSWTCCRCNHPNFDRNLFHSFEIETTNNFDNLNFSSSENVNSPNSDFAPTQHSSPIPHFRPKNRQRNWRTLLINCRSLKGKVAIFLALPNYYQPD